MMSILSAKSAIDGLESAEGCCCSTGKFVYIHDIGCLLLLMFLSSAAKY